MKVLAVNGSPRKNNNTAMMLTSALEGARERGAETELIHMYELDFKGCSSCLSCKRKDRERDGCFMKDGLTPVLEKIYTCDALILGSPIYYQNITSGMSALLERLLFPNMIYSREIPTIFPKEIPTGFIYTMNMFEREMKRLGIPDNLRAYQNTLGSVLRHKSEILYVCDTYQFPDYSKYESSMFSEPEKAKHRKEEFPKELKAAFELGAKLAQTAKEINK